MYLNAYVLIGAIKDVIRLTLTWDVFKWKYWGGINENKIRLTLTWDVFKFVYLLETSIYPCD